MNIQTVIESLQITIEGKEKVLAEIRKDLPKITDQTTHHVQFVTAMFLEINLKELNNILNDCVLVREAENNGQRTSKRC
jgi:hypothetical protein